MKIGDCGEGTEGEIDRESAFWMWLQGYYLSHLNQKENNN